MTDAQPKAPTAQSVITERASTHGDFGEVAKTSQHLKGCVSAALTTRGKVLPSDQQESLDLICMKMARIIHGNHNEPDHWQDVAGYATLIGNKLSKGSHV